MASQWSRLSFFMSQEVPRQRRDVVVKLQGTGTAANDIGLRAFFGFLF